MMTDPAASLTSRAIPFSDCETCPFCGLDQLKRGCVKSQAGVYWFDATVSALKKFLWIGNIPVIRKGFLSSGSVDARYCPTCELFIIPRYDD